MADIFNAFVQGQQLGTQQRLLREQQQREEKINALSGQAFSAAPDQVNQLARTATELGGAQAGQNVQTIAQGQNELQRAQATRVYEEIARGIYDVSRLPEGPEREQAWSQRVGQIVKDPAQRDQLLSLGSAQGINTVVSQIAPVADLLKAYGVGVSGTDAGPRVLSPGAVLVDQQGNPLYRNPAIDRFATFEGQDAEGRPVPYLLGTTGAAAGTVRDPRMRQPSAPSSAPPAAAPAASQPAPPSADFVSAVLDYRLRQNPNMDPMQYEQMAAELQSGRDPGTDVPPQFVPQRAGQPTAAPETQVPPNFGPSDAERAEAAALEERRKTEEKGLAEQGLEYIERVRGAASAASTENARMSELARQLEASGYTGPAAGRMLDVRRFGTLLGIGDVGEIAAGEAARALSNQLALGLRNPAGGEGMPGAMSDADRDFLLQSVPRLETTPDGWRTMIEFRRKINDRRLDEARELARLRREGVTPSQIPERMQDWADRNRIFNEGDAAAVNAPTAQGEAYTVGQEITVAGRRYRVIGGDPTDPELEEIR